MGRRHRDLARERDRMVERDLAGRGITDRRVLDAMATVPREAFVPAADRDLAYDDRPLPIGEGQTISQPYIVALMLELAELGPDDTMLEVGAGCGYAAAVASRCCAAVVGVERVAALVADARPRLAALGFDTVELVTGDGTLGWPDRAPFDAIVVSAGGPSVPRALVDQLAPGGRLVAPVGPSHRQELVRVRRGPDGTTTEHLDPVTFVPLIGAQGWSGG